MKILRQERHTVCFIEFEVRFSSSPIFYTSGIIIIVNLYQGSYFILLSLSCVFDLWYHWCRMWILLPVCTIVCRVLLFPVQVLLACEYNILKSVMFWHSMFSFPFYFFFLVFPFCSFLHFILTGWFISKAPAHSHYQEWALFIDWGHLFENLYSFVTFHHLYPHHCWIWTQALLSINLWKLGSLFSFCGGYHFHDTILLI